MGHWSHEGVTLAGEADAVVGVGIAGVGGESPCYAGLVCLSQERTSLCVIGYPMRCE